MCVSLKKVYKTIYLNVSNASGHQKLDFLLIFFLLFFKIVSSVCILALAFQLDMLPLSSPEIVL
jgi:hypothetical protein